MNNIENTNSICYVARINEIKPIPGADISNKLLSVDGIVLSKKDNTLKED